MEDTPQPLFLAAALSSVTLLLTAAVFLSSVPSEGLSAATVAAAPLSVALSTSGVEKAGIQFVFQDDQDPIPLPSLLFQAQWAGGNAKSIANAEKQAKGWKFTYSLMRLPSTWTQGGSVFYNSEIGASAKLPQSYAPDLSFLHHLRPGSYELRLLVHSNAEAYRGWLYQAATIISVTIEESAWCRMPLG